MWLVIVHLSSLARGQGESDANAIASLMARIDAIDSFLENKPLEQNIARPFDDWVLLRDLCDKAELAGPQTLTSLNAAVKGAVGGLPERRVFLLGLVARLSDEGVRQLLAIVGKERESVVDRKLAGMAANVLGHCGSRSAVLQDGIRYALRAETDRHTLVDLIEASCNADIQELLPVVMEAINSDALAGVDPRDICYTAGALARDASQANIMQWISAPGKGNGVGLLAARWKQNQEIESLLIDRLPRAKAKEWTWTVETLGACGSKRALEALRESLDSSVREGRDDEGQGHYTTDLPHLDPRLLALARLGEDQALEWVRQHMMATHAVRYGGLKEFDALMLIEFFGRWNMKDARGELNRVLKDPNAVIAQRCHAARGLCWLKRYEGLTASAELMSGYEDPGSRCWFAQKTLHHFVANLDRPDMVLDPAQYEAASTEWLAWLEKNRTRIEWRELWWRNIVHR